MAQDMGNDAQAFAPLLRTKVYRPQLSSDLVGRARLIELMNRAHEKSLTLVSAPAGYGKSVVVAQWAEQLGSPIAWLSLDASDSELRVFLRYFLAAVDTASPGACDATRELLSAGALAPPPVLATYLLNDLDAIEVPCAIVLDDYHRIGPLSPVQDLMLRMLEHPPRQFRFVVVTRHDPPFDLPGLRAGLRINEVRLQDLQFTPHETREFLTGAADLSVSDGALTHLEHQVEGWAVGLRLVSLALQHVDDSTAYLERLAGRLPQSQEYLLQEVLAAQASEVRELMLASSILDRFCVELLDSVCGPAERTGGPGFAAADLLAELHDRNLFTIPLDAAGKWFRYHHLFQGLLQNQLRHEQSPGHVSALHLLASEWFEREGLLDEAIKHALAAENTDRAAELVARHRHDAHNADQWYVLANWLALVPEKTVQQHPELLQARAWITLNHYFHIEAVPPLLDRVESLLGDHPKAEEIRGEVALSRGYILWLMGNGAECWQHLNVALEKIPASHLDSRAHAEMIFAMANQMEGRKQDGLHFLDDLLANADSLGETRKTRLTMARVFIHVMAGEMLEADQANLRMWDLVKRGGSPYVQAWTNYIQGVIHLQRCEWQLAVGSLERSVAKRFIHHSRAAVDSMAGLMLAYQALELGDQAEATLHTLEQYVAPLGDPAMENLVASAAARLYSLQGRPEAARRCFEAIEPPPEGALLYWIDIPSITRCQAMIAVGSPDGLAKAQAQLQKSVELSESQHNVCQLTRVLTLLTMAHARQGKTDEALGVLERAVSVARKGDLALPFVELGAAMVDLLNKLHGDREFTVLVERGVTSLGARADRSAMLSPTARRVAAGPDPDSLTNRQLAVLELLAQRLQDKEIAARLRMSTQTVNSHLKQIYQKLGAHGRREAVDRAVANGILSR